MLDAIYRTLRRYMLDAGWYTLDAIRWTLYVGHYRLDTIGWTHAGHMLDGMLDTCCTLYSVRYMLYAIWCTLYAVRYTLYAIRCTLYAVCYMLYAIRWTLYPIHQDTIGLMLYSGRYTLDTLELFARR